MNKLECRVCESINNAIIYDGPIRSGGDTHITSLDGYKYYKCNDCSFVFINPLPENINDFYESDEFRLKFHNEKEVQGIQSKYDKEQSVRVYRIGIENLRDKIVCDFGSGAGLFLDSIKGVSKKTIAVEPSETYQKHLLNQVHNCYAYIDDMKEVKQRVEIATSFDVIEHIFDINGFLKGIYDVMVEGGQFYLSMPQHNDLIRRICPENYESFFYQIAHLNYFNKNSIRIVLEKAGFNDIQIGYLHKYDIRNLIQWAKNEGPGSIKTDLFDKHFHRLYINEIERLGLASHLFITSKK